MLNNNVKEDRPKYLASLNEILFPRVWGEEINEKYRQFLIDSSKEMEKMFKHCLEYSETRVIYDHRAIEKVAGINVVFYKTSLLDLILIPTDEKYIYTINTNDDISLVKKELRNYLDNKKDTSFLVLYNNKGMYALYHPALEVPDSDDPPYSLAILPTGKYAKQTN